MRGLVWLCLLAGATGADESSKLIGAVAGLSNPGLQALADSLKAAVPGNFSAPDIQFKEGLLSGALTDIQCKKASLAVLELRADAAGQLTADGSGVSVECSASYKMKLLITYKGKLRLTIAGHTSVSAGVTLSDGNSTTIALSRCSAEVDITALHFVESSLSGDVLNLFKKALINSVEPTAQKQICAELSTLAATANSGLAGPSWQLLDCEVSSQSGLWCAVANLVGVHQDSRLPPAPPLPELDFGACARNDSQAQLLLDSSAADTLFDVARGMGLFDWFVTPSVLAKLGGGGLLPLNTSTFWPDAAPGLASGYPNSSMRVGVNASAAPSVEFGNGAVLLSLPIEVSFTVMDRQLGPRDVIVAECPLSARAELSVDASSKGQHIKGVISPFQCQLTITHAASSIGTVDGPALQAHWSSLLANVTESINRLISAGAKIPKLGPVGLANTSIGVFDQNGTGLLSLCTDLELSLGQLTVPDLSVASSVELLATLLAPPQHWLETSQPAERSAARAPPDWVARSQASRLRQGTGKELLITAFGAVPASYGHAVTNRRAISDALAAAAPGDTVVVPADFFAVGNISGTNLVDVTLRLDGAIHAAPDFENWPRSNDKYIDFMRFENCSGLTISSNALPLADELQSDSATGGTPRAVGLLDGQGAAWWSEAIVGKLPGGSTDRPRLMNIGNSEDVLVHNVQILNSPRFNLRLQDVARAEVSHVRIQTEKSERAVNTTARRLLYDPVQPGDLNTDGVDLMGIDLWVHHSFIHNDDDSIAVKPCDGQCDRTNCTQGILVEDTVMIGVGASIGSVGPHAAHNCVRNVMFRNISMPHTMKGIYVKSDPGCGDGKTAEITNVTYEDMTIVSPIWWPIWIGPQQQQEPGKSLGDKCSLLYPVDPSCPTQGCVQFTNITVRRVNITNPTLSPGVLLGNATTPNMHNIVFDSVSVHNPGSLPFAQKLHCEHVKPVFINSPSLTCD